MSDGIKRELEERAVRDPEGTARQILFQHTALVVAGMALDEAKSRLDLAAVEEFDEIVSASDIVHDVMADWPPRSGEDTA